MYRITHDSGVVCAIFMFQLQGYVPIHVGHLTVHLEVNTSLERLITYNTVLSQLNSALGSITSPCLGNELDEQRPHQGGRRKSRLTPPAFISTLAWCTRRLLDSSSFFEPGVY